MGKGTSQRTTGNNKDTRRLIYFSYAGKQAGRQASRHKGAPQFTQAKEERVKKNVFVLVELIKLIKKEKYL